MTVATVRRSGLAALLTLSVAMAAFGQSSVPPRDLRAVIRDLDAPSLEVREAATMRLMSLEGLRLSDIEPLLHEPTLTPEQVARLDRVAFMCFQRTQRGALGVQFGNQNGEGTEIAATVAGFDASVALRPRDVVRSAGGVRLFDTLTFRAVILSYEPGDAVPLEVIRDGRPMRVEVRLGRFADLQQPMVPDYAVMARAWELRRERAVRPSSVIDAGLEPGEWEPLIPEVDARASRRGPIRVSQQPGLGTALIAGGLPRQALQEEGWRVVIRPEALEAGARDAMARVEALQLQRQWFVDRILAFEAALRQRDLPAEQREALLRQRAETAEQLRDLEETIRAIRFGQVVEP
ncbi:MAG: PDZ domain-containing protein [Phycisphaeraceae bacterium]|nr:PDZ domain-containing protein [Phycisphaeraceae bacterium]